jgi:hypothetical protein
VLGVLVGPVAHDVFDAAKGAAVLLAVAAVVGAALVVLMRRGRRSGAQAWTEAARPAFVVLALLSEQVPESAPVARR